VIRTLPQPRRMADTERGKEFRSQIAMLERLIEAYRNNDIRQQNA
jgi:fructose-1,6-bisphosphatase-3